MHNCIVHWHEVMKFKILFVFIIFLSITVFVSTPAPAEEDNLKLKIEVFQALREGVRGVAFDNDYARIGLPFPKGMVKELNGRPSLSVIGAPFQTRTLKKWPDGSVKWGLIEFLTSVSKEKKNEVYVKKGQGVIQNKFIAIDSKDVIAIDTGPLQVEIKKKGFNIFDKVIVAGKEIVRSNSSRGVVLIDGTGNEFLASLDENTKVSIEDNGPVAAVIRVDGGHFNSKNKLLDYTMRLFFCQGKNSVKVEYTLRNASVASVRHAFIKSLNLETALNLTGGIKTVFSTHSGTKEVDLGKGDIVFYQAVSDFPWVSDGDSFYYHGPIPPDYSREEGRGYAQEGYRVWQNENFLIQGRRNEFPDLGFIDISDSEGLGMTAGIRYMAGQWPKSLKVHNPGKVMISLWPKENGNGYWIRYGSHTTFEVLYVFHADLSTKPMDEMERFQYPLIARAPIDWYNKNVEGMYPLYHLISFSDEKKLAQSLDVGYGVGWRKPKFRVWRYHYWGLGAFLNQHDFGRIALMNSVREDRDLRKAGEWYLSAEVMFNYYADWAVYHSDDYDYAKAQFRPSEHNDEAELAKVVFEWEHQHWYGMSLYYYMTGDERIKEAVLDWGEYIKKLASPLSLTYMRVFGTGMFSLAAMYEFTGDKEFLHLADMNFNRLLEVTYSPQNSSSTIFIDWDRGIVAGGSGSGWPGGVKVDVMMGSILYDGLFNYYFFTDEKNPLKKKAYNLLMKMSEFMLREPYVEGSKRGHWAYWLPYVYNLTDKEKSDHSYKLIGQASFWTVFPYIVTGEKKWLEQMGKMMKMALWDESGVWGSFGYIDHPGYQTIGYYLNRQYFPERYK